MAVRESLETGEVVVPGVAGDLTAVVGDNAWRIERADVVVGEIALIGVRGEA